MLKKKITKEENLPLDLKNLLIIIVPTGNLLHIRSI